MSLIVFTDLKGDRLLFLAPTMLVRVRCSVDEPMFDYELETLRSLSLSGLAHNPHDGRAHVGIDDSSLLLPSLLYADHRSGYPLRRHGMRLYTRS